MKIIKAETFLKPVPTNFYEYDRENDRVTIDPIKFPSPSTGSKFNLKPRAYVFSVHSGEESWTQVKYDLTSLSIAQGKPPMPIKFDLPGELILNDSKSYSVFLGYNDGFLGGSFAPGYYSLKEKVQYWYTLARTSPKYRISDYFIEGNSSGISSLVIDVESVLKSPKLTSLVYYKIGDPITIGNPIKIGEQYEQ